MVEHYLCCLLSLVLTLPPQSHQVVIHVLVDHECYACRWNDPHQAGDNSLVKSCHSLKPKIREMRREEREEEETRGSSVIRLSLKLNKQLSTDYCIFCLHHECIIVFAFYLPLDFWCAKMPDPHRIYAI